MRIEDNIAISKTTGQPVFRRVVLPENKEPRGVFLMLHGLGDHQGCHVEAAELLAAQGFASVGFDWPGNGASVGIRGDIPGIHAAVGLIDEHHDFITTHFPGKKIGVYAHSTGGFFILRHIALRETNPFQWLWLSSPLLNPRHGKSQFLQKIAPVVARLFPKFTIPSGVTRAKMRHLDPTNPIPGSYRIEGRHSKISLRLGADLLLHADDLKTAGPLIVEPTNFLITQGGEDEVCPPEFSHTLFETIATEDKNYALLHGLRHEMFREPANAEFIEIVENWLGGLA